MATRYRLFPDAEPQPDRQNPPLEPYGEGLPEPQDVRPIEVADTSLDQGRRKPALPEQAGIPEVWGVHLVEGVLEVHPYPKGDQGRPQERVFPGEAKAPLAHPDRPIPCR